MTYVAPQRGLKSYTCPHCGVFARQYQFYSGPRTTRWVEIAGQPGNHEFAHGVCEHCQNVCLWHRNKLVYPNRGNAPAPNPDMPDDVKADYEEAASIYTQSPRGGGALLRLAIQKLCPHLGGTGKNINKDIKTLVDDGLPEKVQKALDIVRVIGNNAVHPGQIETDDPEMAGNLFVLVNVIVEHMISMPKRVEAMFSELPHSDKEAIDKRDAQSS